MNGCDYLDFCVEVSKAINTRHPSLRRGQVAYNLLFDFRPDLAREIVGTNVDPFHDDSKINMFMHRLAELWA